MRAHEKKRRGRGGADRDAPAVRESDVGEIRRIVEPVVEEEGFELLDLVYVGGRANAILRLVLDHPDAPVTVGDCSRVSRAVGRLLDGLDVISRRYHLEVSSPGVDRVLRTDRDFLRFRGSLVKVSLSGPVTDDPDDPLAHQRSFSGRLAAYDPEEGALLLETEAGAVRIPRSRISRARLEPAFQKPGKPGKGRKNPKSRPRHRARP